MPKKLLTWTWVPTLGLLGLAGGLAVIFGFLARQHDLKAHVPEFVALTLAAGALYVAGVYFVETLRLGLAALFIILAGAVLFRFLLLPAAPSLSDDVYRYQWDGRVNRAHFNPYTVFPAMRELQRFQDPKHPLEAGATTPSVYPPLSEIAFSSIKTVGGYKRLFTALDLASVGLLLALLTFLGQPLHRVLIYAWNPIVVVAFALCGHHDSLAIATLLMAELLIIGQRPSLSIALLAVSALSKYFPVLLLPVFLKRTRWVYAGVFGAVVSVAYLPYLGAGRLLFKGLRDYARGWEANDSLFRLIRLAGNSKAQAGLVAGAILLVLLVYILKRRMHLVEASLFLITALLLLSPNAFPWYFTWLVPFLCFAPSAPLLLMSITAVLGYAPVIAYAAGLPYRDSPFILALEYVPVYILLAYGGLRALARDSRQKSGAGRS